MLAKFICGFSVALAMTIGSILWVSDASAGFGFNLPLPKVGSIHCGMLLDGGGNQARIDGTATCSVQIRQVVRQCVNKAGKSDTAQSENFAEQPLILTAIAGNLASKTINGPTLENLVFSDVDILRLIQLADPSFSLDPAVVCPNKNWKVTWNVTRIDLNATVSTVAIRCKGIVLGNGKCSDFDNDGNVGTDPDDAIAPVPYWSNPLAQFSNCNPASSTLAYAFLDNDGNVNPLDPAEGKLDECIMFKDWRLIAGTPFDGPGGVADGGCVVPFGSPVGTAYSCLCSDHGFQSGNWGDPHPYQQFLGATTPADLECTGEVQIAQP